MNEALGLDPENTRAYKHLGVAYYALKQDEECIAAFETYLALYPDDPNRETMEATIAELEGAAATVSPIEYHNAEGGYGMLYPDNLLYDQDGARVVFAGNEAAIQAVFESAMEDAVAKTPVVMCDVLSLAELAEDFDLEQDASPDEFLMATVESLEAEMGEIESGVIGGYPAVLTDISGDFDETSYRGGVSIIIVEDSVVGVTAMVSPDRWEVFRPTFIVMVNSLSFEP